MNEENKLATTAAPAAGGGKSNSPSTLGSGLAFESVSQSTSMAVQDAATFLRHMEAISAAAIAVLTEKYLATQNENYNAMIGKLTTNLESAAKTFEDISEKAMTVLGKFPKGSSGGG